MKSHLTLSDHDAPLADVVETLAARDQAGRRSMLRAALGLSLLGSPLTSYAACAVIPSETAGPFPGDGTNGPSALAASGVVRSDIRANFGASGTTLAPGVPMTVVLKLVNTDNNCALLPGFALYLWHCDAVGNYSMYGSAAAHNFLRGVQVTDANGSVKFTTMFPGAYSGRYPHMHFEIFKTLTDAGAGRNAIKTSQLALTDAACREVYTEQAKIYSDSLAQLNATPFTRDGIFADGGALQMAAMSGNVATGFTATLTIGVAAGAGVGVAAPAGNASKRAAAIEFYNTALDHYVVVSDPAEVAMIDAGGAGNVWQRTGQSFFLEESPAVGGINVYRFYGSVTPGPNSHFYTVSEDERASLIALAAATPANQKRWNYEGVGFRAGVASNGGCVQSLVPPAYSAPVYRLYNNGFPNKDSNHRYTTSTAIVQEMQAKGWKLEGVAFCAMAS